MTISAPKRFGLGDAPDKGALVTQVAPRSPAAAAGVAPGDLITKVGNDDVTSAADVREALKKSDLAKGVPLYVSNREGSSFRFLKQQPER